MSQPIPIGGKTASNVNPIENWRVVRDLDMVTRKLSLKINWPKQPIINCTSYYATRCQCDGQPVEKI